MYLLDTNILALFVKQNSKIIQKIQNYEDSIALCVVVQAECLFGAKKAKMLDLVDIYNSIFESFPNFSFESKSCEIFTDLKANLSISGKIIEDFDLIIASICLANNLTLVTHNTKHFDNIKGLKVEDWTLA